MKFNTCYLKLITILFLIFSFQFSVTPIFAQTATCPETSHECALKNQNNFLLPPEVTSQIKPKDQDIFRTIIEFVRIVFGFQEIKSGGEFAARAETQNKALIPPEVAAKEGNSLPSIIEKAGQDIGSKVFIGDFLNEEDKEKRQGIGIYPKDMAPEAQINQNTSCDFEKLYEQSNFPAGIVPISQSGCQTQ